MKTYNYLDIKEISCSGITFFDNHMVKFEDCKREWAAERMIALEQCVCVGERDISCIEPYFLFYTKERVKILFKFNGLFKRKKCESKFKELQLLLIKFGFTSYDLS